MKVTVERAELLKSLGHVHRVVERRNTIPILANVLMRAEKAASSASRRPTSTSRSSRPIAAEVAPGGSTTVPAHMFYEIVRKLPEGSQVVLEASGDRAVLAIRAGRSRFTLQTLPESDFPDLAAGDMTHKFTLAGRRPQAPDRQDPVRDLDRRDALLPQRHLSARRRRAARPQTLRAVATDGHRLAQVELAVPAGAAGMPGIIVPRKTVGEVQRLIEDGEAEVDDRTVAGQDPLHDRRRGADLEADRRHLPGLRPRHPDRQRQGARWSTRRTSRPRSIASRRCRASAAAP